MPNESAPIHDMFNTQTEQITNYIDIINNDGEQITLPQGKAHVYRLPSGRTVAFSREIFDFHTTHDPKGDITRAFAEGIGLNTHGGLIGMNPVHGNELHVASQQSEHFTRIDGVDILINSDPSSPALFLAPADCNGACVSVPGVYGIIHAGRDGLGTRAIVKGVLAILNQWAALNPGQVLNLEDVEIVLPPQVDPEDYNLEDDRFRRNSDSWWVNHTELVTVKEGEFYLDLEQAAITQIAEALAEFIKSNPQVQTVGKVKLLRATLYTGAQHGLASHSAELKRHKAALKRGEESELKLDRNLVIIGQTL